MHQSIIECSVLKTDSKGFSFPELLITIAVTAIVLGLAVPYFKNSLMNDRMLAQRDMLMNALDYARNTALNQNINVQACPFGAVNSTVCGTNWQNGWAIISRPAAGNPVLLQTYQTGPNDPVLSIVPIGGVSAAVITFDPVGIATTQANFKLCDSRGAAYAQSIQVLSSGLVQTASTMGVAVWNGGALTCP